MGRYLAFFDSSRVGDSIAGFLMSWDITSKKTAAAATTHTLQFEM
jgi:hypothetical protein